MRDPTLPIILVALMVGVVVVYLIGHFGAERSKTEQRERCPAGYVLINADHYGYSRVCVPGVEPE